MGEPLRTTGKRYIEMTTAEWIGRLVMPVKTFPSELREGKGEILKLREEKEIKLAVEWFEEGLKEVENYFNNRTYGVDEAMVREIFSRVRDRMDKAFKDLEENKEG